MHLLAERVFMGDNWDFLKEGVKTYLMSPAMLPLKLSIFNCVLTSVYAVVRIDAGLVEL
jgi:hypothetical protein